MFFFQKMFFTIDLALYTMTLLSVVYVIVAKIYYDKRRKELLKDVDDENNLDDSKKVILHYLTELFTKIPITVLAAFIICTTIFTILTIIIK